MISPQYRGDREEKGLLARSILEIIRRREVYKVWSFEQSLVQSFEQSSEVRLRPMSFATDDFLRPMKIQLIKIRLTNIATT